MDMASCDVKAPKSASRTNDLEWAPMGPRFMALPRPVARSQGCVRCLDEGAHGR